jgi:hypothetical protein
MIEMENYDFSFTAVSLRINEMVLVARAIKDEIEVDYVNDLGAGKSSTGKRMLTEFKKRISLLTKEEIEILIAGDFIAKRQIAFVSICKTYAMIKDFAIEVLREKMLVYDYQISEGDYISFYRRKVDLHEKMESLSIATEKKIRQVIFRILAEAGLINDTKERIIQPQIVDHDVANSIILDNAAWLRVLLLSDMDIQKFKS